MDSGCGYGWGGGCQFIVERPDFPRACVVNSVYYSTVYPKRGRSCFNRDAVLSEKSIPRETVRPAGPGPVN